MFSANCKVDVVDEEALDPPASEPQVQGEAAPEQGVSAPVFPLSTRLGRVQQSMVAACDANFEDVVHNKMGCGLIIDGICSVLFIVIVFGYSTSVLVRCISFLEVKAEVKEKWGAQHFLCPFSCGDDAGGAVEPGYAAWGCTLGGWCLVAAGYVYYILGNGFTDFRQELVLCKTEQKDNVMTMEGAFYEDVTRSYFFSEWGDKKLALMAKAKYIGKLTRAKESGRIKNVIVDVKFDDTAQQQLNLKYFDDSTNAMKNSFKEKLGPKLAQPIDEKKPDNLSCAGKSKMLPQAYSDDPLGIAEKLISGGGTKVDSVPVPKNVDFWMTYLLMVLATLLFFYVINIIFSLFGLVFDEASGECKKDYAKEKRRCDIAQIFSPVPIAFVQPGDYLQLVYFIFSTLGTFVWWYFAFPDRFDFYEEGIVEMNAMCSCLQKWFPSTAKVVLYQEASAASGKDAFGFPNFQVKTITIYKGTRLQDAVTDVTATLDVLEPVSFEFNVQGDDLERVKSILKSSKPGLVDEVTPVVSTSAPATD